MEIKNVIKQLRQIGNCWYHYQWD